VKLYLHPDTASRTLGGLIAKAVEQRMGVVRGLRTQRTDAETGRPLWLIECIVDRDEERGEFIKVQVPSDAEPVIVKYAPITFGGDFHVEPYNMGDNAGVTFRATTWTQEARPSTQRPPVPEARETNGKTAAPAA
jgi:hypothetical protein